MNPGDRTRYGAATLSAEVAPAPLALGNGCSAVWNCVKVLGEYSCFATWNFIIKHSVPSTFSKTFQRYVCHQLASEHP